MEAWQSEPKKYDRRNGTIWVNICKKKQIFQSLRKNAAKYLQASASIF